MSDAELIAVWQRARLGQCHVATQGDARASKHVNDNARQLPWLELNDGGMRDVKRYCETKSRRWAWQPTEAGAVRLPVAAAGPNSHSKLPAQAPQTL